MEDLHDNHEPSTRCMGSDWLKVKCQDVGVKCKQSHVVKCSVDHHKCLVNQNSKQTYMGTQVACMLNWPHDQNTWYKSR